MAYKRASDRLYSGNKAELSRLTGISERTIYNRRSHPEKTTVRELALIAKVKHMSATSVMEILEDLA